MRPKITKLLTLTLFCFHVSAILAQVTIGSGLNPVEGALLDLKEKTPATVGDATGTKGLGLPRVELKDMNKLIMSNNEVLDSQDGGNQYHKHTGLMVYHVSGATLPQCEPIPDGLYVWNGSKWKGVRVAKPSVASLAISGTDIYFPSGQDLRIFPTTPETFSVSWTPSTHPVTYTYTPDATWGGIIYNGSNMPPASGVLTTSPFTFNLLPNAMTAEEVKYVQLGPGGGNPFLSRQDTLRFTAQNECGETVTEMRIINQTNKAMVLSQDTVFLRKAYKSTYTETKPRIRTNADWKLLSIKPALNSPSSPISNVKIDGVAVTTLPTDVQTGYELNNNTAKMLNLSYDVQYDVLKERWNYFTFADANVPKRFTDVTVTVLVCPSGSLPTIEEWAKIVGFSQTEIDQVKSSGMDSQILDNGIQMHRLVSSIRGANQIFLSSNFGASATDSDQRWMIHNLDATAYDGVTHAASRSISGPDANFFQINNKSSWAYPMGNFGTTSSYYDANQRIGLLYTWDTATAGKGGADGEGNVYNTSGGTSANNEGGFAEGIGIGQQKRVQGICPKGWHLPSDYELTQLENATSGPNSILFSTTENATASTLGNVWKEICDQAFGVTNQGASHWPSPGTRRPGLDIYQVGSASNGQTMTYNSGFLWSSSSSNSTQAWVREVVVNSSKVTRNEAFRSTLLSVRCKKD